MTAKAIRNLRDNLELLDKIKDDRPTDVIDRMWEGSLTDEDLEDEQD